jgi:uncharacterized membrane protein
MHTFFRDRREWAILASLLFSSAIATLLYVLRVAYTGSFVHGGMIWNLFLAWLPMVAALFAYRLAGRSGRARWLPVMLCAFLWLLFFPNAPYLLTDIGNVRPRFNVPYWYDVLMYVSFAWSGTFLGLVSLYLMQDMVRRLKGPGTSWLFAIGALLLSGFGVYLGRFPRFNSWDVFTSPLGILGEVWDWLANPAANMQMFAFTTLFSLLLVSVYLMLVAVVQFPQEQDAYQR